MTPARGLVFVRPIQPAETRPGGRVIVPEGVQRAWTRQQCVVVSVGRPSVCDVEDCSRTHAQDMVAAGSVRVHPTPLEPGDWIVIRPRSLRVTDGSNLQCCAQDDVLAVLHVTSACPP